MARRAIGKKKFEVLQSLKQTFIYGDEKLEFLVVSRKQDVVLKNWKIFGPTLRLSLLMDLINLTPQHTLWLQLSRLGYSRITLSILPLLI